MFNIIHIIFLIVQSNAMPLPGLHCYLALQLFYWVLLRLVKMWCISIC